MKVLNCWEEEIDRISGKKSDEMGEINTKIQPSLGNYSRKRAIYVSSASGAEDLLREANMLQLSHVGLNTIFSFDGHILAGDVIVPDIQTIRPYLLAVALVEHSKNSGKPGRFHNYVINLRVKSLHRIVQRLFRLPVCFVGYDLRHTFFCLWQLNITGPEMIWDVLIHEKTMHLGLYHSPAKSSSHCNDIFNQIKEKEDRKQFEKFQMGWQSICQRYGVSYWNKGNSKAVKDSIFNHPRLKSYTAKQLNYAADDAIAASKVYPHQISTAAQSGILHHLINIEMPFITTVARMEWIGVGFDHERSKTIVDTCRTAIKKFEKKFTEHGIGNPLSPEAIQRFFRGAGILNKFASRGTYSFEKEQLRQNIEAHPVVRDLLDYRQLSNLLGSASKLEDFVAFDDRLHAQYDSVGSVSGRLTTRNPNIVGLDGRLRHLIIPESGNGIGEVDWCQFEVGITAAVYGDDKLLSMFNNGDVYTLMAKEFFRARISNSARKLTDQTFKQRYPPGCHSSRSQ
ncbi:DNA polymerase [Desulfosarcina widdelii]|uniref:DNA polymerase n=1 Tax=Desulfosarcina widdelii TaxID=947919 RepID=UPI0012D2E76F|nr:DNA polymerase [Desulfosarcina widdelii]